MQNLISAMCYKAMLQTMAMCLIVTFAYGQSKLSITKTALVFDAQNKDKVFEYNEDVNIFFQSNTAPGEDVVVNEDEYNESAAPQIPNICSPIFDRELACTTNILSGLQLYDHQINANFTSDNSMAVANESGNLFLADNFFVTFIDMGTKLAKIYSYASIMRNKIPDAAMAFDPRVISVNNKNLWVLTFLIKNKDDCGNNSIVFALFDSQSGRWRLYVVDNKDGNCWDYPRISKVGNVIAVSIIALDKKNRYIFTMSVDSDKFEIFPRHKYTVRYGKKLNGEISAHLIPVKESNDLAYLSYLCNNDRNGRVITYFSIDSSESGGIKSLSNDLEINDYCDARAIQLPYSVNNQALDLRLGTSITFALDAVQYSDNKILFVSNPTINNLNNLPCLYFAYLNFSHSGNVISLNQKTLLRSANNLKLLRPTILKDLNRIYIGFQAFDNQYNSNPQAWSGFCEIDDSQIGTNLNLIEQTGFVINSVPYLSQWGDYMSMSNLGDCFFMATSKCTDNNQGGLDFHSCLVQFSKKGTCLNSTIASVLAESTLELSKPVVFQRGTVISIFDSHDEKRLIDKFSITENGEYNFRYDRNKINDIIIKYNSLARPEYEVIPLDFFR